MSLLIGSRRVGFILLIAASLALSQVDRSSLSGDILDQSGRAIPNVLVFASESKTGSQRNTKSNSKGTYSLPDLPIGTWTIVFSAPGFRNTRYENVDQSIGQTRTLNPVLELAVKGDELTVNETLARLNQASSTLSEAVEQKAISDLPLNGRHRPRPRRNEHHPRRRGCHRHRKSSAKSFCAACHSHERHFRVSRGPGVTHRRIR